MAEEHYFRTTKRFQKQDVFNDIANCAIITADDHTKKHPDPLGVYDTKLIRNKYEELVPWGINLELEYNMFMFVFYERVHFNKRINEFRLEYLNQSK